MDDRVALFLSLFPSPSRFLAIENKANMATILPASRPAIVLTDALPIIAIRKRPTRSYTPMPMYIFFKFSISCLSNASLPNPSTYKPTHH